MQAFKPEQQRGAGTMRTPRPVTRVTLAGWCGRKAPSPADPGETRQSAWSCFLKRKLLAAPCLACSERPVAPLYLCPRPRGGPVPLAAGPGSAAGAGRAANPAQPNPARPRGRCGGAMVEAWYMDESQEDQRAPHRQRPNRAVSLEQLRRLGVVYRRVRRGTEGTAGCTGPGRAARRRAGRGRQAEAGAPCPCGSSARPALPAHRGIPTGAPSSAFCNGL